MKPHGNKHGMNWISQVKRLAIYLRDGLACAYCGTSVEQGASLCLDHIVSRCHGGTNKETNLITACKRCNDSKNSRSVKAFAKAVAIYLNHGVKAHDILVHIHERLDEPLDYYLEQAKRHVAERGSAFKVLESLR
jgi:hypothetical protein